MQPAGTCSRIVDPADFTDAFREHFDAVYRFIRRRVGPDLAADTFATAYRRRAADQPGLGTLRSWLYGIAMNVLRNHWRAERRFLELEAQLTAETGLSACSEAADRAMGSLLAPRLAAALISLTREQREVLLLCAWAELSHEEIAAALRIAPAPCGPGCREHVRRCASNLARLAWIRGFPVSRKSARRQMGMVMGNEIEPLRKFREDTPGPSASAWARAESAVEAAMSGAYPAAHGRQPGRITRLRPRRRRHGQAGGTLGGMTEPFAARFARARARYGPLVLGADPHGALLRQWSLPDDIDGLRRFTDMILDAADGTAGIIKPQAAFFERHGWRGIRELTRLVEGARARGLLVIADVKRGDVGSTNEAYAQAYLGQKAPIAADAITVSPYLGLAAMDAFTSGAHEAGAGIFVVTRSSNPEGRIIRSARTDSGTSVEHRILAEIGELNARLAPGAIGPVGAVVGAGEIEPPLDLAAANALYLAPGVGAQGAAPEDVARTFAACPDRVLPSASRSLLAAGPDTGALREAVSRLNEKFRGLL